MHFLSSTAWIEYHVNDDVFDQSDKVNPWKYKQPGYNRYATLESITQVSKWDPESDTEHYSVRKQISQFIAFQWISLLSRILLFCSWWNCFPIYNSKLLVHATVLSLTLLHCSERTSSVDVGLLLLMRRSVTKLQSNINIIGITLFTELSWIYMLLTLYLAIPFYSLFKNNSKSVTAH